MGGGEGMLQYVLRVLMDVISFRGVVAVTGRGGTGRDGTGGGTVWDETLATIASAV